MSVTNVLIVEDEFIIAEDTSETLHELGYHVIGSARNYDSAIEVLNSQQVDIVLIDINLGGEKDGIDLGETIRETYQLPFIFITSHADKTTVERAKHLKPNGYLVKPFDKKDLYTSIEIALSNFSKNTDDAISPQNETENKDSIFIKDGSAFVKLKFKDIWLVKSDANYVSIKTEHKKHLIRKTLKEFGLILPQHLFFQVHKSFIINLSCIDSVHSDHVMVKQQEVPIGREYKEAFLKKVKLS